MNDTPATNHIQLELHVPDFEIVKAYYSKLGFEVVWERKPDGANVVEPLILQPWGSKDFRAVDPFGYYLRFTSKHNILDKSNAVE